MKYWLHRITGGDNAEPYAQPLLDKGFLSIGWMGLSNECNKDYILRGGAKAVDELYSRFGWKFNRSRYCLSRFIYEMKQGDVVLVPSPGRFSLFEISDNNVFSNETIPPDLFSDHNGIKATKVKHEGYYSFFNNFGDEVDLGFFRRVKPLALNLSRYSGIAPELYAKMRFIMTNIDITSVGYSIDEILSTGHSVSETRIEEPIVLTTDKLMSMKLSIPIYQRPYVWTTDNVGILLSDIRNSMDRGKECYRLGSIILHENDIVDGQQRISTLAIIRKVLCQLYKFRYVDNYDLKYNHVDSFTHLRENHRFIQDWLLKLADPVSFGEYVNSHCECVVLKITGTDGLAMAFKLFDSQNGRGKPLEAYNLLKAYHLRAMNSLPSEEKIKCDRNWEHATRYHIPSKGNGTFDILKQLFNEQLYRTRIWCRHKPAWNFAKRHIDEFKGINIDKSHGPRYPFQNKQMLQYMTEMFYRHFLIDTMQISSRFSNDNDSGVNPFMTICKSIVNGRDFFEFINTYVEMYKRLFLELDSYQLREFKSFYQKYCIGYGGYARRGDSYIRELYKSLVMCLFDKFGEAVLNNYYKVLYLLVYILRRQNSKVFYQTVAKYPIELFSIILDAKSEHDLKSLYKHINATINGGYSFDLYEDVLNQLNSYENK